MLRLRLAANLLFNLLLAVWVYYDARTGGPQATVRRGPDAALGPLGLGFWASDRPLAGGLGALVRLRGPAEAGRPGVAPAKPLLVQAILIAGLIVFAAASLFAAEDTGDSPPRAQGGQSPIDRVRWQHLSSARGELPAPGTSTQQTGALVADLDGDGINDFVLSFRQVAPALVWYRRVQAGWTRHVLEPDFLTVEAGGAACDIDGHGDLDLAGCRRLVESQAVTRDMG